MKNTYFKLFGNCFIVNGYCESILYDLENHNYYPIPNDIANILKEIENTEISIDKIEQVYGKKSVDIKIILNYFVENNLAHFVSNPKNFPKINLEWKSPYKIENAIIEFDNNRLYDVIDTISQLNKLGCQAIEFRFIDDFNLKYFLDILNKFTDSSIRSYIIASKYNKQLTTLHYKEFVFKYRRISRLLIFVNSNISHYKKLKESMSSNSKVIYLKKELIQSMGEKISTNSFVINTNTFIEAQSHNLGLNRKVCIDKNGFIKNFLNHNKTYGKIQDLKIKEVIESKEFQQKWGISNTKIEKCKDCQYQYMCISNSDIFEQNGKFYKVNSCSFDPYKNLWY